MSESTPRRDLDLRLADALKGEFTELRLSGPTAGVAFRAALASVLSMIVAMALNLDNPYWAAITAVSIVVPDVSSSFLRSVDRCLGTVIGAAVGYFGARGDMDQAITIRTLVFHGDEYSFQAGAGVVADSVPEAEYDEVLAKSGAMVRALALAEEGL